jgi:hypothetical protein
MFSSIELLWPKVCIYMYFSFSPCCMSCLSHPPWLHNPNKFWQRVHIWNTSLTSSCNFLLLLYYFIFLIFIDVHNSFRGTARQPHPEDSQYVSLKHVNHLQDHMASHPFSYPDLVKEDNEWLNNKHFLHLFFVYFHHVPQSCYCSQILIFWNFFKLFITHSYNFIADLDFMTSCYI